MRFTHAILFAALVLATSSVALPTTREHVNAHALAQKSEPVQNPPSVNRARSFLESDELYTRSFEGQLYARYVTEGAVEKRSFFKKLWGGIKTVGKGLLGMVRKDENSGDLQTRSSEDELYTRNAGGDELQERGLFGKIFKGVTGAVRGAVGGILGNQRRELSSNNLETRSFEAEGHGIEGRGIFGKIFKGVTGAVKGAVGGIFGSRRRDLSSSDLQTRSSEAAVLSERDGIEGFLEEDLFARSDDEDLYARDLEIEY